MQTQLRSKDKRTQIKQEKVQRKLPTSVGCFLVEKLQSCGKSESRMQNSWKLEEKIKYLAFIDYFLEEMRDCQGKELWSFYKAISFFIKTRNPNQCRIYHNKMLQKFNTLPNILLIIQKEVPDFQRVVSIYRDQLINLMKNISEEKPSHRLSKESSSKNQLNCLSIKQIVLQEPARSEQQYNTMKNEDKDEKIDNMRTDISIKAENEQQRPLRQSIGASHFQMPSFPYPPQNPVIHPMSVMPPFWSGYYGQGFVPSLRSTGAPREEDEWAECHRLYLAWTQKLRGLMSRKQ